MIRFDAETGMVDRSQWPERFGIADMAVAVSERSQLADALDIAVAALRKIEQRWLVGKSLSPNDRDIATAALRQIGALTAADDK